MEGIRKCGSCGSRSQGSTARMGAPRSDGRVPRVAGAVPVRYSVNGKRFATLTAAQDYALKHPGAVIRQL